ncbi:MAG TPA: hypothetical protein VN175_08640 [Rhizomicrobium sp.]|nr:hypothetical protein [Rhizomicrobium sp.]
MGKFITGLLIGLLTGLIFADMVFPEGFTHAVEQLSARVQNRIPGR